MFSWLVIVSFIVSILFYALFPRGDAIQVVDKPWANFYPQALITQHLAAWQSSVVKDVSTGEEAYVHAISHGVTSLEKDTASGAYYIRPGYASIERFLPLGSGNSKLFGLQDDSPLKSVIFCIDNATSAFTSICSVSMPTSNKDYAPKGTSDFLVTYAILPDSESFLAIRQMGEKALMIKYNEDIHLRVQCGMMTYRNVGGKTDFQPGSKYFIDNTRYNDVTIPTAIGMFLDSKTGSSSSDPLDILLCVTRLNAAYDMTDLPGKIIYPGYSE